MKHFTQKSEYHRITKNVYLRVNQGPFSVHEGSCWAVDPPSRYQADLFQSMNQSTGDTRCVGFDWRSQCSQKSLTCSETLSAQLEKRQGKSNACDLEPFVVSMQHFMREHLENSIMIINGPINRSACGLATVQIPDKVFLHDVMTTVSLVWSFLIEVPWVFLFALLMTSWSHCLCTSPELWEVPVTLDLTLSRSWGLWD